MSATELLELHTGPLLIVGGAEDKTGPCTILRELIRLAGGASARIAVITTASQFPREVGGRYVEVLTRLGARHVEQIHVTSRSEADGLDALSAVQAVSAVYFTGGVQSRIVSVLGGTPLAELVRRRWHAGLVVGGTSAGAAALSELMIVGSPGPPGAVSDDVMLGDGLGFTTDTIVDQHFSERRRLARLLRAVAFHPDRLGMGVDEDTAVVMRGTEAEVIGRGAVTLVDARPLLCVAAPAASPTSQDGRRSGHLLIQRVSAGRRFSLGERLSALTRVSAAKRAVSA